MTRAEFYKGLIVWLEAHSAVLTTDGTRSSEERKGMKHVFDELIVDLKQSVAMENKFPWEKK